MKATITVDNDPRITKLFAAEEKKFPRGGYEIAEKGKHIIFTIYAKDAVALRAIFNSIAKTLIIWEKTEDI